MRKRIALAFFCAAPLWAAQSSNTPPASQTRLAPTVQPVATPTAGEDIRATAAKKPEDEYPDDPLSPRFRQLENEWRRLDRYLLFITGILSCLAIIIGVATVFGWGQIKRAIAEEVKKGLNDIHSELSGRILGAEGVVFGLMARDHEDVVLHPKLLERAIKRTHESREALERLKGDQKYLWRTKNNLAYYYALKGDPIDAKEALKLADAIRDHYASSRNPHSLDTYARVMLAFHELSPNPKERLKDAAMVLDSLINNPQEALEMHQTATRTRKLIGDAMAKLGI